MSSQNNSSGGKSNPMTQDAASRIQSTQTKAGHDVGKDSFAARAQSAGDRNANAGGGTNAQSGGKGK
ncbi:hypothetical protein BXZ70DRAFT_505029 [Cristinia sonorae]|uniref:SMP domain-containing protein n=1 Tax=Cristinia sonorae TaxID=1940300 RepID=A0A8K0XTP8_9AGAR|nr:hypothetical protein BXZ70DRAFT_505029 [Cristinia sonorae]